MTRVYLAGPMRGKPDLNRAAFAEAAARLRGLGLTVFSPAEADEQSDNSDIRAVFRRDVDALLGCDMVVMLPGWEQSRGAVAERALAKAVGMPRVEYEVFRAESAASIGRAHSSVWGTY